MEGLQTQVFNSELPESVRRVKRRQLNIHQDFPPEYEFFAPEANSGTFQRLPGQDIGNGRPNWYSSNPLNRPLSLDPNPTWNTQKGYNSLNLNPYTFNGNIGDSLPVIGRNVVSQMTNLENMPQRHLVMTNKPQIRNVQMKRAIPRLPVNKLGKD